MSNFEYFIVYGNITMVDDVMKRHVVFRFFNLLDSLRNRCLTYIDITEGTPLDWSKIGAVLIFNNVDYRN